MKKYFIDLWEKFIRGMQNKFSLRKIVSKTESCLVRNSSLRGAVCVSHTLVLPHICSELCLWGRKTHSLQGLRMVQHNKHSLTSWDQFRLQRVRLRHQSCSFQNALSLIKAHTPPKNKKTRNPTVNKNKNNTSLPAKISGEKYAAHSFPEICYFFKGRGKKRKKKRYLTSKISTGWLFSNPGTRQITTFLTTAFQPSNPTKNCAIRILNALGTELIPDGIQLYSSL